MLSYALDPVTLPLGVRHHFRCRANGDRLSALSLTLDMRRGYWKNTTLPTFVHVAVVGRTGFVSHFMLQYDSELCCSVAGMTPLSPPSFAYGTTCALFALHAPGRPKALLGQTSLLQLPFCCTL